VQFAAKGKETHHQRMRVGKKDRRGKKALNTETKLGSEERQRVDLKKENGLGSSRGRETRGAHQGRGIIRGVSQNGLKKESGSGRGIGRCRPDEPVKSKHRKQYLLATSKENQGNGQH